MRISIALDEFYIHSMDCPWSYFTPSRFTHCEEQICGWIVNPADAWTNIGFFVAAFFILRSKADPTIKNLFGVTTVIVGIGSILFHSTLTAWGAILDMETMIIVSMLFVSLALMRLLNWSPRRTVTFYVIGFVLSASYPLWIYTGKPVFGFEILMAIFIEWWLLKKKRPSLDRSYFLKTLAVFAIAICCLVLDVTKTVCEPKNHIFTLHGAWHFLNSLALYLMFLATTKGGSDTRPKPR